MRGLMMDTPLLVSAMIEHAASVHGDMEIVARTIEGGLHRYSYAEAALRCRRLAQALLRLGVQPGDRVASLAWNTHHHFELFYGVSGFGAVLHTINPRLFEEQLVYIVNHAEDSWICIDGGTIAIAERLAPRCPAVKGWIYMSCGERLQESTLKNLLHYEALIAAESGDYAWPEFDERTASTICYTSGTTGHPKGVVYSHRSATLSSLIVSMADMIGGYQEGAIESAMAIAPMFHGNAWQMPYTAPMNGHRLVLPGRAYEPEMLLDLLQAERVTIATGVPTVWLMLTDLMDQRGWRFEHLRAVLMSGSKPPLALAERLERDHGVRIAQCWGMTEALGAAKGTLKPGLADRPIEERMRYRMLQGRLGFGTQARIVDDAGRELPRDGIAFGHLLVRGPIIAAGYFRQEASQDGWLHTGDIARIHPDGYLELVDRSKDVIKSGGEWISSVELENAAMGHPAIRHAAVIGIAHPKWQERPLLIAVRRPGAEIDGPTLLSFLAGKVARWWLPDDVVFIEEMPMTATGKLHKLRLREQFRDYRPATDAERKPA
ncbi:MAG: long-chain fatty acid--CoA ligase [Alphaproteobacteria bacterium]|nr:long-chain fatty acid--CoA ligase [Alphaproteobacteria bacterium]